MTEQRMHSTRVARLFLAAAVTLLLAACSRAGPEWVDNTVVPTVPDQTTYDTPQAGWTFMEATITPRADFVVEARVLGVERYRSTATSHIMPFDMALGWMSMSNSRYLRELDIWQGQRRYYYQWDRGSNLEDAKMAEHSANMHMIPSNVATFEMLSSVRTNYRIRITGVLVNVDIPGYGILRTSMTRKDMWDGACEIIWVTHVEILPPPAA